MVQVPADRDLKLKTLRESPPSSLLDDPLEYLIAEHARQRMMCDVLDDISNSDEPDKELVGEVLNFLKEDFKRHVLDEEMGLLPALEHVGQTDARFRDVLARLRQQHDEHRTLVTEIISLLENLLSSAKDLVPDRKLSKMLQIFATVERDHLILENAIVLPIAKAELSSGTLVKLSRDMMARRSIEPEGEDNAE